MAAGVEDGADAGVEVAAPSRAEAIGDLAEDSARADVALGSVVARRHGAVGKADHEIVTAFGEAAAQADAGALLG